MREGTTIFATGGAWTLDVGNPLLMGKAVRPYGVERAESAVQNATGRCCTRRGLVLVCTRTARACELVGEGLK